MTNREILLFQSILQAAENVMTTGVANSILKANDTKIYEKVEALHKSYTAKGQKIVALKRQLVELYAAKDKDGHAIVRAQEIEGKTIIDYDYGGNRGLVESTLGSWLTTNNQRRSTIDALWDTETDIEWELIDDKDIPENLKEDLLPITRQVESV